MISWGARRQIQILFLLGLFALIGFGFFYLVVVKRPPSCTDGAKNQNELGVDCGGVCKKVCQTETEAPIVRWSRYFKVRESVYDLAAMVENTNVQFMVNQAEYTLRLYDAKNKLVVEKTGTFSLKPTEKRVILVPVVEVGNRTPSRLFVDVVVKDWQRLDKPLPSATLKFSSENVDVVAKKVSVRLTNLSAYVVQKMDVAAVLFDEADNVVAVSSTYVNELPERESSDLNFVWPEPWAGDVASVIFYPNYEVKAP